MPLLAHSLPATEAMIVIRFNGSASVLDRSIKGIHVARDAASPKKRFNSDFGSQPCLLRMWAVAPHQGLVLGFGNTPAEQIPGAILRLKEILNV